jgi:hypothetical protein
MKTVSLWRGECKKAGRFDNFIFCFKRREKQKGRVSFGPPLLPYLVREYLYFYLYYLLRAKEFLHFCSFLFLKGYFV